MKQISAAPPNKIASTEHRINKSVRSPVAVTNNNNHNVQQSIHNSKMVSNECKKNITTNHTRRLLDFIQKQKTTKDSSAAKHQQNEIVINSKSNNKRCEKLINSNDASNNNGINRINSKVACTSGIDRKDKKFSSSSSSAVATPIPISTKDGKSISHMGNHLTPFVSPSKRSIQHHDYQNLVDDASKAILSAAMAVATKTSTITTTTSASSSSILNGPKRNSNRNQKNGTYDSVVNPYDNRYIVVDGNNNHNHNGNNNNRKIYNDKDSNGNNHRIGSSGLVASPIYRHFGDTNLLRNNNGKSMINYNGRSVSSTSLATTALANDNNNSSMLYDKNRTKSIGQDIDCIYPEAKRIQHDKHGRIIRADIFPIASSNSYVTNSNLTNDTGFSSMDADNTSNVTPTITKNPNQHLYSACNQIHCLNYDVKNRIKMFDVDTTTACQQPLCHNNYKFYDKTHEKR